MQAAFVAAHGHAVGGIPEGRTTFLAFVAETVCGYLGILVVAHGFILDLTPKKSQTLILNVSGYSAQRL